MWHVELFKFLGTNVEAGAEREEIKEPPPIPPADGDASPGDGGTWEDVAEDNDPILTPDGDDDEPSSEEAPKVIDYFYFFYRLCKTYCNHIIVT